MRRGAEVQIVKGLQGNETVVVAGQQRLQRDGTVVKVVDMAKAVANAATTAPASAPAR